MAVLPVLEKKYFGKNIRRYKAIRSSLRLKFKKKKSMFTISRNSVMTLLKWAATGLRFSTSRGHRVYHQAVYLLQTIYQNVDIILTTRT